MSMMSFYVSSLDFLLHSSRTLVIRDIAVLLVAVLLWKVFLNLFVCYSVELFGFFPLSSTPTFVVTVGQFLVSLTLFLGWET